MLSTINLTFTKRKTGRFAKIIFYFLRTDKPNSCTAVITKKAVNWGEGEEMQVPCTLKFEGKKKHIIIVKNELVKIDK